MADVTADRDDDTARDPDNLDTAAVEAAATDEQDPSALQADRSRAVRVRPAAAFRRVDDPTLVVAPLTTDRNGGDPAVLAQRHGFVDGDDGPAFMIPLDAEHARLHHDDATTDVVLEPPVPAARGASVREVLVDGFRFEVEVEPDRLAALRERATRDRGAAAHAGPLEIRAVIPGRIVSLAVAVGDQISAGGRLLVVEAMKMQNELVAPSDGTIGRVGIGVGDTVEIGDVLVVIE